jgi:hypothetical protein
LALRNSPKQVINLQSLCRFIKRKFCKLELPETSEKTEVPFPEPQPREKSISAATHKNL